MNASTPRTAELLHTDIAIVGAGPAGIAAAVHAAAAGRRVVILDEGLQAGGQIWRHAAGAPVPRAARSWIDRLHASGATVLTGTSVVDVQVESADSFVLTAEAGRGPCHVHAAALVIATGARERFLPFPGWTLPGVIGAGGAQALLKSGASFRGRRVVVAGSGPLLLPVAAALARNGARLAMVAEQAGRRDVSRFAASLWRRPVVALQAARYRAAFPRTRYRTGTWVARAEGDDRLRAVTVTDGTRAVVVPCDVLCTGYGLVPNTELARLAGCDVVAGVVRVNDRQETSVPHVYCAGEPTGIGGVDLSLLEGRIAGLAAAGRGEVARAHQRARDAARLAARDLERAFACRPELRTLAAAETIVCRCEDICREALRPEWSARQAKLYTRAGMGPCQGRVCGAALDFLFGWGADHVQPPLQPAAISTLLADAAVTAPARGHRADGAF